MKHLKRAFSLLELILAVGIFAILTSGAAMSIVQIFKVNRLGEEMTIASEYASEGMEASRSIKNQGFANLVNSAGTGIIKSGSVWIFSGTANSLSKYTRVISVSNVNRDGSGNIVASGGTLDTLTKKIQSTVNWNFGGARSESVNLISYLSNWGTKGKAGILAYGDSITASDIIKYKIFDGTSWGGALNTADIDASTNRALQVLRVYSSPTRNEKIILSRHYNGTTQYIYGQVFDGTSWGNVQPLSNWNAATFLDVQNFDGTYLNNGDFLTVFSDNSTTPKFRVWNGTVWGAQISMQGSGGVPNFIFAKSRPGTNEVMAGFFDQSNDTNTEYYNGSGYSTGNWTLHTEHATNAATNTRSLIDFSWSPNSALTGSMIYSNNTNDRALHTKIWTANGSGGGSWSSVANTGNQGSGSTRLGAMANIGRPGANEFLACNNNTDLDIYCYLSNFTPTWTNPTNQIITTTTQGGIQRTFHIGYENVTGTTGLIVYSDNTSTPKFKKYDTSTNTFDLASTSVSALSGTLASVEIIPQIDSDDMMILLGAANSTIYTIMWDGANNATYSTPAAKALTLHGSAGAASTNYWYDFAFDAL
jgi:prepilin-type N-terminal cleavage/methylation domain-containing protein